MNAKGYCLIVCVIVTQLAPISLTQLSASPAEVTEHGEIIETSNSTQQSTTVPSSTSQTSGEPELIKIKTTHSSTPKVIPDPPPFPHNIGVWWLGNERTNSCILLEGALKLTVKKDVGRNINEYSVDVPSSREGVIVSGVCGPMNQSIQLEWVTGGNAPFFISTFNRLKLGFTKEDHDEYMLSLVEFEYQGPVVRRVANVTSQYFPTTSGHSFRCNAGKKVHSSDSPLSMSSKYLRFEAFRRFSDWQYGPADVCKGDYIWKTVGIVLGSVTATVILLILVVFLKRKLCFCSRADYQTI